MSDGYVSKEASAILAQIDAARKWDCSGIEPPPDLDLLLHDAKKHIYFLESEIAQLKKVCAEWSEVSQHNYQKAKSMALALDAIRAVVKATSTTGETE